MQRIKELLGCETPLDAAHRAVRDFAQSQRAAAVGAVQVTCSDESEREQSESFQHWFVDPLLPELKFSCKSPFRSANLGARYEWGAIRIAEQHFATRDSHDHFKLMVVKLNSHVAVQETGPQTVFGSMARYGSQSTCCGALAALLSGLRHPATDELRLAFSYDGVPRLDMLRDHSIVSPELQSLAAAVVNARLQARSAIVDIQDYVPASPTVTVVLPTVTINRQQRDTELLVGMYWADSRAGAGEAQYVGLGDDPSQYAFEKQHGYLRVRDQHLGQAREARNHRHEVVEQWRTRRRESDTISDRRIEEIERHAKDTSKNSANLTRETLTTVLWLAADITPVPLSIMLFAKGLAGVHHLYRVHRLARGIEGNQEARNIITEVSDQIAKVPVGQARETIESIAAHVRQAAAC